MKILYGVQATGNGHISRARVVGRRLAACGADVTWLFSGRPRERFFDMEQFGDFHLRHGMTFNIRNGAIRYARTALESKPISFVKDALSLDLGPYDVIVTDFEPIVAWAGRRAGKTVIGIGHQYAFAHDIPVAGDNFIARLIVRHFAPADIPLGLHWHHFNQPILPPIIDLDHGPTGFDADRIVVYLPFEDRTRTLDMLRAITDKDFLFYAAGVAETTDRNVHLRRFSVAGFRRDLSACGGVICNAGFELTSEALRLGKNILVKPVKGQMEQLSNVRALQELGYGQAIHDLDHAAVAAWARRLTRKRPIPYPDVGSAIADWLLAGDWNRPRDLARELWQATERNIADAARPVMKGSTDCHQPVTTRSQHVSKVEINISGGMR